MGEIEVGCRSISTLRRNGAIMARKSTLLSVARPDASTMRRFLTTALSLTLAACSHSAPPAQRDGAPVDAVRIGLPAAEPMPGAPAPDAKADWVGNGDVARFGFPGQGPMLSVECRSGVLLVTRHVPAEVGAQALFALQGGGHILRLPVDATSVPGLRGYIWQGALPASDPGGPCSMARFAARCRVAE